MNPTDDQLRDPKWWDENAPEDADIIWLVWNGVPRFASLSRIAWAKHGEGIVTVQDQCAEYHPRPTKPAAQQKGQEPGRIAPEWDGEGLPPVGCECEVSYAGYWVKAKVIHSTASGILVSEMFGKFPGKVHVSVDTRQFRPLRTKEQWEREEIESIIHECSYDALDSAAAIIAAGFGKGDS